MDTTVHPIPPHPEGPYVFEHCKFSVFDSGVLHVFRPVDANKNISVAFFGVGGWSMALPTEAAR